MTAKDARQWQQHAGGPDTAQAEAVRRSWEQAIEKAAKAGKGCVAESEVGRLRMPVTPESRTAALAQLKAAGFAVKDVDGSATVSW